MHEPVLSGRGVHPCSLVRAIGLGLALGHNHALLIRSPRTRCLERHLPSGRNSSGRREDVVIAVVFIELGAFDCRLGLVSVIHYAALSEQACAVRRHRRHEEHALVAGAAACASVRQICLAVLVPKRAWIYESLSLHHPYRVVPLTARVSGLHHEDAPVRVSAVDVELSVVIADCRSPYSVSVLRYGAPCLRTRRAVGWSRQVLSEGLPLSFIRPVRSRIVGQRRSDDLPVHQICRVQDLKTRETAER